MNDDVTVGELEQEGAAGAEMLNPMEATFRRKTDDELWALLQEVVASAGQQPHCFYDEGTAVVTAYHEALNEVERQRDLKNDLQKEREEQQRVIATLGLRLDEAEGTILLKTDEIERLQIGRKNDDEMIRSLRHRLRSGLAYGNPLPCPRPCNMTFCQHGGCRFQADAADEAANV